MNAGGGPGYWPPSPAIVPASPNHHMRLVVQNRTFPVQSLSDASTRYQRFRGTRGASVVGEGMVYDDHGVLVARVSYNGRVWPAAKWQPGMQPILEATEVLP